jgi:hypothetical protein
MIVLGVIRLILGGVLKIGILWTIGIIVLIIGVVFFVLGQLDQRWVDAGTGTERGHTLPPTRSPDRRAIYGLVERWHRKCQSGKARFTCHIRGLDEVTQGNQRQSGQAR